MPISANSVVQTGPNTHAGGLRAGFTIPAYQPAMDGDVKKAPITPAISEMTIDVTNLKKFFNLIFFYPHTNKLQFVRMRLGAQLSKSFLHCYSLALRRIDPFSFLFVFTTYQHSQVCWGVAWEIMVSRSPESIARYYQPAGEPSLYHSVRLDI